MKRSDPLFWNWGKMTLKSRQEVCLFWRRVESGIRKYPKPRPEGCRDFSEEGTIGHETCKMVGRGMFMPEEDDYYTTQKPEEALEPSQTGEVPPEPSKGRGDATQAKETASSLEVEPMDQRPWADLDLP